jgi:hypothetical protein
VAGSEHSGEFAECGGYSHSGRGVEAKFVVSASQILHEGVPGDDHLRRSIGL